MIHAHQHPNPLLPYGSRRHADPVVFTHALAVDDLCVRYPGAAVPVLDGVSVRVPKGTRVALVGPNGAGKSSLLKAVAGVLPVERGTVSIFGNPVGACHHRTAYLPQRGDIDWTFPVTVERLVLSGRYVHLGWLRWPRKTDREIVARVLERIGIADLAHRPIAALSGGQQQRALIARALAQGADLMLLDEPFNNLDAATRAGLRAVMDELAAAGKTLVVATHDTDRLTDEFDIVVKLTDGGCETAATDPQGASAWAG